jgi:hypothetical protein
MGGLGFGQGYFGQYATHGSPPAPPATRSIALRGSVATTHALLASNTENEA